MNIGVLILSLIAAVLAQGLIPGWGFLAGARTPVVVGVVVYYALSRDKFLMLASALIGGVFIDGLSSLPLGCSSFLLVLLGFFVYSRRDVLFVGNEFGAAVFGGITCLFYAFGVYVFLLLQGRDLFSAPKGEALGKILGSGLLGLLSAPVVYFLNERFDRVVGNVVVEKNGQS